MRTEWITTIIRAETSQTEILRREREIRNAFGITRVASLTGLDRTRIPVACAVVPGSASNVSIFGGRGLTEDAARCGALMETIERQTAARCAIRTIFETAASCELDLNACGLREEYRNRPLEFVSGYDLFSGREMLVPKALVQMPWRGPGLFSCSHTNGLAAAPDRKTAAIGALYELLERHLWSLTHARACMRPRRLLLKTLGRVTNYVDDPVDCVRLPCGDAAIDELWLRIENAGMRLRLVAMQHPDLPAAMLATIIEERPGAMRVHVGSACNFSAPAAAIAAITEAVQSRVNDTQGARENILHYDDPERVFGDHMRRRLLPPSGRWYYDAPAREVSLSSVPSASPPDVLQALVDALRAAARHLVLVTLSQDGEWYTVVRAIAPQLETIVADGRVGRAALAIANA